MQKLAEICVRRPVFATMIILSLTVVGLFSYKSLGVDLFPKIDLPTITVTVINPGASPQEIETEITDKVEGAVNTISGIDELRSTSVEGASQVFITFLLEKNADVAAQEVRNKVDLIVNDLPVTAEKPIVQKLDTDADARAAHRRFGAPLFEGSHRRCRQADQAAHRINQRRGRRANRGRRGRARSRSGSIRTNCALTTSRWPKSQTP